MPVPLYFEVCATTLTSVQAAHRAGASRVELCTALDTGGLTPSAGIIRQAVRQGGLPVHVLLRPREGDFCYSDAEWQAVLDDVEFCRTAGAAGVVIGALTTGGEPDWPRLAVAAEAAGDLEVTLHRAFDLVPDPFSTLDRLVELGFRRVLTSGQAASAWDGRELLRQLVQHAAGRITVMPGGGITPTNVGELLRFTGASAVHFSAKIRRAGRHGGFAGLDPGYWESEEAVVREVIRAARED